MYTCRLVETGKGSSRVRPHRGGGSGGDNLNRNCGLINIVCEVHTPLSRSGRGLTTVFFLTRSGALGYLLRSCSPKSVSERSM